MKRRDVVEAIIYNDKMEVLMQKKTTDYPVFPGGCWCYFGGEVEDGESSKETLIRELKEEMGIEVSEEDIELIYEEDYVIDTRFEGKQYAFKVKFLGKLSDIKLTEGAGFAFFDRSELVNLKMPAMERDSLKVFWESFE